MSILLRVQCTLNKIPDLMPIHKSYEHFCELKSNPIQPVEALSSTGNFLKVTLRVTFKKFSGFYYSAKRCKGFKIREWHCHFLTWYRHV